MGGNEEQENGHMIMEVVTVDARVNELLNYINKKIIKLKNQLHKA